MATILKIRKLSEKVARAFLEQRIEMGFPLLKTANKDEIVQQYRDKYLAPLK